MHCGTVVYVPLEIQGHTKATYHLAFTAYTTVSQHTYKVVQMYYHIECGPITACINNLMIIFIIKTHDTKYKKKKKKKFLILIDVYMMFFHQFN